MSGLTDWYSRSTDFNQENKDILYSALVKFATRANSTSESKVNKEQYLLICESLGHEPDTAAMPFDLEDFPDIVHVALTIYNNLRDTYIPGDMPHYIGKDLSPILALFSIHHVTDTSEQKMVLDVINIFDAAAVKASRARIDAANKKIKKQPKK
jgi:hypothetical protein